MKPTLAKLWAHFPDHTEYPNLQSLYTMLGGVAARNINSPGFGPDGNTCASRLSIAFNKSGAPISASLAAGVGAKTLTAGDGSRIIFVSVRSRTSLTTMATEGTSVRRDGREASEPRRVAEAC